MDTKLRLLLRVP